MRVYYFSRKLRGPLREVGALDIRARHAGIIIDDPQHGLVRFEVLFRKSKAMEIDYQTIVDYYVNTSGRLAYQMGETNLTFAAIKAHATQWEKDHSTYEIAGDNCRAFADFMLRKLVGENGKFFSGPLPNSTKMVHINKDRFQESPCEEAEHRILDEGMNVPSCIKPSATTIKPVQRQREVPVVLQESGHNQYQYSFYTVATTAAATAAVTAMIATKKCSVM